jgi:hypothetical protein
MSRSTGMQGRYWRWSPALGATMLLAVVSSIWWGESVSPADTPQFEPQLLASFTAPEQLRVAVALENPSGREWTDPLQVEVLAPDGRVLARQQQAVRQKERWVTYSLTLPLSPAHSQGARLRCRLGTQQKTVPLSTILLLKGHETSLLTGQEFFVGSRAPFLCDVHAVRSATQTVPLAGAQVRVQLRGKEGKSWVLCEGRTGRDGRLEDTLAVPVLPAGSYVLEVETRSPLGEEKLQRPVQLKADAKILLVTDKPIYQPGQEIHLRALVLRPLDLRPVENIPLLFEIEDGKGNKVFKKTVTTSAFGVASTDFQLADEVNQGDYHLRASWNEVRAEKTVLVKRYVLPRFKVQVTADKKFYLPRETVRVQIQADYFFGKPLAQAQVQAVASTFDVAFRPFHKWQGQTDDKGHATFEVKLPDYFVGQPLEQGNALLQLEVKVTDRAAHSEQVSAKYTVSAQPIQVHVLPAGGKLVPGMENVLFIAAVYPDGSPAASCEVRFWLGKEAKGEPLAQVRTNALGLAEIKLTPRPEQLRTENWEQQSQETLQGQRIIFSPRILLDAVVQAQDAAGNRAVKALALNVHPLGENILLRLNQAVYRSGDTLEADIRTSAGLPTVYLDLTRNRQLVLSRWLEVQQGQARYRLDLPPDLFGAVEVHAYQVLASGEIIRDSRVIYIQPRNDLKVEVTADKEVYRPGERGRLHFQVSDAAGKPVQAALGVLAVDEAVYALQEMQPGLEKVYFTLQEELLKPQVEIRSQPVPLDQLLRQPVLPPPQQQAAQVLLTAVQVPPPARWQVAPDLERKNRYIQLVQNLGWSLYRYAWNHDDYLTYDAAARRWQFAADLSNRLQRQGYLSQVQDPLAGSLTLEDLLRQEPGFTVEALTRTLTQQRLRRLAEALEQYARSQKAEWFRAGRWQLPPLALLQAARQAHLDDRWLQDAWGQAFKLVPRKLPAAGDGTSVMDFYDLVSAGPDRDYGTEDDLRWSLLRTQPAVGWWSLERAEQLALSGLFSDLPRLAGGRGLWREDRDALAHLQRRQIYRAAERLDEGRNALIPAAPGAGVPLAAAPVADAATERAAAKGQAAGAPAAPIQRIREYFPETLLWQPNLITDEQGRADLAIHLADSITTWRLTASASSRGGGLGGAQIPLKVFQDFFVEPDLPVGLTQHDEVAFPVAVYNYLKESQKVKIELQQEPWFDLVDPQGRIRELTLQPGEVTAVHFRIRARQVGFQPILVKAYGSRMSDAVKRLVEVVPYGQKVEQTISDRLRGTASHTVTIPAEAVPEASRILVRIYPGVLAQVLDGLEGMLRLPGGCMEQTSSSAYPNILVVEYLKKTKKAAPEILLKAEHYLSVGYQRLLTFERPGGGFDWWGSGPPLIWLSAYGLQEFSDMARVYPVDPGVIQRTQAWLLKQREPEGTWSNVGATHSETIAAIGHPKLVLTSYVAWSLLESGLAKEQVRPSIEYIRTHLQEAGDNAYILALAANALAAYDPKDDSTLQVLRRLEQLQQQVPDWKAVCYPCTGQSLTYARGNYVTVETTALTALAMIKTGQFTNSVNKALTYLIKTKEGNGTWGSTSATILSLKALLAGMSGTPVKGRIPFTILVNGQEAARGEVTEDNADLTQTFDLRSFVRSGENQVEIRAAGETPLMYQIIGRYYRPWDKVTPEPAKETPLDIRVEYDRTRLATNDLLQAKVTLQGKGTQPAYMVMVDLGVPPGFSVAPSDFADMVRRKQIERFGLSARTITLYLNGLRPGEVKTLTYTLRARYPIRAQAPGAVAYEYYTPTNRVSTPPVALTVEPRR